MKDKNCLARDRTEGRSSGGLHFEDFAGLLVVVVVVEGAKKGVKGWRWAVKRRWMPVASVDGWSLERINAAFVESESIAEESTAAAPAFEG